MQLAACITRIITKHGWLAAPTLALLLLPSITQAALTIGVFAYRDASAVEQEFAPVADALRSAFPERKVELNTLSLEQLEAAIEAGSLDFVLTNPLHFLTIRHRYDVSGALATLSRPYAGHRLNALGGVIVTRSDRAATQQLEDLEGLVIGIPGKRFLGGYLTQAYEIYQRGFRPENFAVYRELGNHDAVIQALLDKNIDAGFVRTGTLELWQQEGREGIDQLKVLNAQQRTYFPLEHSTRLYPEWSFAALPRVSEEDKRTVSRALLNMPPDAPLGFVAPMDYLRLEETARALQVPPYNPDSASLLLRLQRELGNWLWVFILLLSGLIISLLLLGVLHWRGRKHLVKIKEQRQALNHILWGTAAGTWEWNVQTGETRFNERWAEMVGYRLAELQPTTIDTWMTLCHPDDLARSNAALQDHFEGRLDSYSIEARMRHRDGHWIWVHDRGRIVQRDDAGEPLWMAGTHTDITSRKEAEVEAFEVTEQLKKLATLLPGTIYQYHLAPSGHACFPYASSGIEAIYGVTAEEAARDVTRIFNVIHPDDREAVAESIQQSAETLTIWHASYRVNHPNGKLLWIDGIATPERLSDGGTMWHGYLRDITAAYLLQKERDAYRESLEKSNQELEHFAYAASHDLRQPLRMVTSYGQLLQRHLGDTLDDDGRTMLHYMKDGASRIDNMLLSLLEYSRVGRKGQPMQAMSLKASLEEALHFLKPSIDESQAQVTVTGDWPDVVASPDEMTRLFQNLIGNALKYCATDKPVTIDIAVTELADPACWKISVCDNGIGIAPEQIERLFKVFQRLHTREKYEGTGVGLAICRKIIDRYNGRIWIESEGEGKGSCCIFTLPRVNAAQGAD